MALSIGELTGTIGLDESPFSSGLDKIGGLLEGAKGKWVGITGAAGLAAGALFGSTLGSAMDTQEANAKLTAQLGLTQSESKRIGGAAGRLYSSAYGDSLEEVNEAVGSVIQNIDGMRDASDASLEKITGRVMSVAQAFDQDLGGVTMAVGQMMRTGLAKNAEEALDIITVGMQNGANKADDLLETFNEYGTQFHKVGLSGKDALGLMTQGLKAGARDADIVADSIKEFSIRTQESLEQTDSKGRTSLTNLGAAFERVLPAGTDMYKVQEQLAGGGEGARKAFDMMLDGLRAVEDPAERTRHAVALFGTQAEDMGDALYALDPSSAVQTLGKVEGAAKRVDKTMGNTAKGNLTAFTRTITTGLVNVLGGQVIPLVTRLTGALRSAAGMFGAVTAKLSEHKTTATVVGGIIAGLLAPAFVALGVQATIAAAKQVAAWAVTSAAAVASRAMQLVSLTLIGLGWLKAGAQAMLAAGRMAAAWLLALGPIGWAIAAIALVVVLVIKYWDQIKAATVKVWSAITGALGKTWAWIKGLFTSVMGAIGAGVRAYFNAYRTVITTVFSAVWGFIKSVWSGIRSTFTTVLSAIKNTVSSAWGRVKSSTTAALSAVVGFVHGLPGRVVSALSALGSRVASAARTGFGWLRTAASEKAETLLSFVKDLPARIVRGLGRIGSLLYDAGQQIVQGMINGLKSMAGRLASAAKDMAAGAVKSVKNALGIASPSKVMRRLGLWTGEGLANGIEATTSMVAARAADLAAAANDQTQRGLTAAAVGNLRPTGVAAPSAGGGERVIERVIIERGPLFGDVYQQPGESSDQLAERLWALTNARGTGGTR